MEYDDYHIINSFSGGEDILRKTAEQFGVSEKALFDMYMGVMESNLEQDLWDIAKENLEELKEEN